MDIWALWPDGCLCPKEEIPWFNFKSDDYQLVIVLSYDETGYPILWRPYKGLISNE